jgi:hypothetical protein
MLCDIAELTISVVRENTMKRMTSERDLIGSLVVLLRRDLLPVRLHRLHHHGHPHGLSQPTIVFGTKLERKAARSDGRVGEVLSWHIKHTDTL